MAFQQVEVNAGLPANYFFQFLIVQQIQYALGHYAEKAFHYLLHLGVGLIYPGVYKPEQEVKPVLVFNLGA